jgi:hypothetical protein
MFDPTIFDNMKVVLEGAVYDLDFAGEIVVTGRIDRVELSTMSRTYALRFKEQGRGECSAEVRLSADISDLAAELLQKKDEAPGCRLTIRFMCRIRGEEDCREINGLIGKIWGGRPSIRQTISFVYDPAKKPDFFQNEVQLDFDRKLDEAQVDDFPELLRHVLTSLRALNRLGDHF